MSSHTETGHAKNVAYFHDLIAYCIGYGGNYNPSRPDLRVGDLQTLETSALATLADVLAKKTAFNNTVNLRMDAFRGIKALATRIINALQATLPPTNSSKMPKLTEITRSPSRQDRNTH